MKCISRACANYNQGGLWGEKSESVFSHAAIRLTTDITQIEEWQGGDIVIFQSHIGIVSDRRNADGIPYVIHHNDPWQTSYEQDILEKRDDIVGHYRMTE